MRTSKGCWTCRLRRKKCDEAHPACGECFELHITCYNDTDKPAWMDGGARQEEMANGLKREIKENARSRRSDRRAHPPKNPISPPDSISGDSATVSQGYPGALETSTGARLSTASDIYNGMEQTLTTTVEQTQHKTGVPGPCNPARQDAVFGQSDTMLVLFYLEHLLPFMFPFYRPSLLQGDRAWILEMMIRRPVVRQATLCQSSYFFSLARASASEHVVWETVLSQTKDAFEVLRRALQVLERGAISEHVHGAVRILSSIVQLQRFEIAILSFQNCQAHLNAALTLFMELLDSAGIVGSSTEHSRFSAIMKSLGPSSWIMPTQCNQVPSAEQAALRFSSTLLILDDIIASTVQQEPPRLYELHRDLLERIDNAEPLVDLEAVVGCQNWVLLHIGEIAVLDAWKQRCKRSGSLDVMELVQRATTIKDSLDAYLAQLEREPANTPEEYGSLLDVFLSETGQRPRGAGCQTSLVTRVWAHAAFIYLSVVVSGWQPASVSVSPHVTQIIELLAHRISPPALLRTMVWPFCVAGCLAQPAQESQLRGLVDALQPPSVFGTARKALEIMEDAWRHRDAADTAGRDLATCFRSRGDLVLLV